MTLLLFREGEAVVHPGVRCSRIKALSEVRRGVVARGVANLEDMLDRIHEGAELLVVDA